MKEGSTEAPTRHPIDWQDPAYTDLNALDAEMRRVGDICHTCRRCFNLCDSFPRLFDLIDGSETGELDSVASSDFKPVVDACTLCDMCFMTKCPYVPPHEFNLDFPHLMLRYRAAERKQGIKPGFGESQLTKTDRNGRLARFAAPMANWASARGNALTRPVLKGVAHVHEDVVLPKFHSKTFVAKAAYHPVAVNDSAPAKGRKAVLYATCFVNYNNPDIGAAARTVLARNGVETEVVYPECCGMPQLEDGDIGNVACRAVRIAGIMTGWIEGGYDIVAMTPSCALMLKFEWPLMLPDNPQVRRLADSTFDLSEYVVDIAKKEGLADGMTHLSGSVAVHLACHARAQNMGAKAAELLRQLPGADITIVERCSGHGGSWGIKSENFPVALKVGAAAAQRTAAACAAFVVSECPLAGKHILQGMEKIEGALDKLESAKSFHPIELMARAYGTAK